MDVVGFDNRIQHIRAINGWKLEIECSGAWIVTVYDKETGKRLASTGMSTLAILPEVLEVPFKDDLWTTY